MTVTAGSEEEGRILGGRVAGIITRGDLEERMIAMGASIGRLTLASPDPIVENALGPDPVYVDVYKEVPVEVVQEVRVKDRTVVSLTAALLIVLAAVLGAAAGLVGHRLYVRARGPDQDDIARLYHDKETRHLLAGHSSSQSPPHSRPASRSVSRTHTRTRTHTRGQSERRVGSSRGAPCAFVPVLLRRVGKPSGPSRWLSGMNFDL